MKKGFTLAELMVVAVILILLGFICLKGCSVSDGDRVGVVAKLSNKGVLVKSWEGQLMLGAQATAIPSVWEFSVEDDGPVKEIQHALETGNRIRLHYSQVMFHNPLARDTDYYVTSVEEIKQ